MSQIDSSTGDSVQLGRQISLLPLVVLIFFSCSGGAYSLEALIPVAGPGMAILLLMVMPLVYGIPIAAIATELSTAMPAEGGTYVWAKRGIGKFAAFQAGLLRWLEGWVGIAVLPVLFANYLSQLFAPAAAGHTVFFTVGPFTVDLHWIVGVVCVIVPTAVLNIRGSRSVGDSALLFAVFALGPLAILTAFGFTRIFTDHVNPVATFVPNGSSVALAIAAGLPLVMWSYSGLDRVGLIAGEIKNPTRAIPKAMFIAVIVIIASYVLPLTASLSVGGWQTWEAGSFGMIGAELGGPWLVVVVTVGGMFAAIGLYSSLLMGYSRSIFVLADDGWVPAVLGKRSRRYGTPVVSIVVSSAIYAIFSMFSFEDLVVVDVFVVNLLLVINLVALIALRVKEPNMARPAKIPGGWLGVSAVGVPMTVVIVYATWYSFSAFGGPNSVWLTFAILALSVLLYVPARVHQRRNPPATATAPVDDSTSPKGLAR